MDIKTPKVKEIKKEKIHGLSEKAGRARVIAFCDYHGLGANQMAELRKKVREAGGEFLIAKNTLVARALKIQNSLSTRNSLKAGKFKIQNFAGPTAVIFAYGDEVAPIKAAAENAKTTGLPKFKFGFFGKDYLDEAGLEDLAKIPGRDILYAKAVGALASPIRDLVYVMQANIKGLVSVLDQAVKGGDKNGR